MRLVRPHPTEETYGTRVEAENAREKLAARMVEATVEAEAEPAAGKPRKRRPKARAPSGGADAIGDFLTSREG